MNYKTFLEIERMVNRLKTNMLYQLMKKSEKYGTSWKTCDIQFLRKRLHGEIEEWEKICSKDDFKEIKELIDIANVCAMIIERLQTDIN